MPLDWEATSKVTNEFLYSVFNERPRHEILADGSTGGMVSGFNGFLLYGGRGLGKTSDIIKCYEMIGNYQAQMDGLREQHIAVIRNSNANFMGTIGKSIGYWYSPMSSKMGKQGYIAYDTRTQPKILVRYPRMRIDRDDKTDALIPYYDGTTCENMFICYPVDKIGDEDKMKGGEVTSGWANEANTMPREGLEMLISLIDRYPAQGASYPIWVADLNPTHVGAWDYEYFFEKCAPNIKTIKYPAPILPHDDPDGRWEFQGRRVTWLPNPDATIHRKDHSYWYNLLSNSDDYIVNNVLGEYLRSAKGRSAYSGFDPDRHVATTDIYPEGHFTLLMPTDFGVKCCILTAAITDEGVCEVYRCHIGETGFKEMFKRFNQDIRAEFGMWYMPREGVFIGDPRTGKKQDHMTGTKSKDVITADGWRYTVPKDPESGKIVDNRVHRHEALSSALKHDKLLIHADCIDVIDALAFGAIAQDDNLVDKKKSGKYSEVVDCLEYLFSWIELGGVAEETYSEGSRITHSY